MLVLNVLLALVQRMEDEELALNELPRYEAIGVAFEARVSYLTSYSYGKRIDDEMSKTTKNDKC